MPRTEAQIRATKKWNDAHLKERYDRLQLIVPAGQKKAIEAAAAAEGESVNMYVQRALLQRMGLTEWAPAEE